MKKDPIDIHDLALDIIHGDISEDAWQQLIDSQELAEEVQTMTDIRCALAPPCTSDDVEEALVCLHRHVSEAEPAMPDNPFGPRSGHRPTLWAALIAAAAIVTGVVMMVYRTRPASDTEHLFAATTVQKGICLSNENGDQATLSPHSQQNTSLTLADFQQIFSDAAHIRNLTLTIPYGKSADIMLPDSSRVYPLSGHPAHLPILSMCSPTASPHRCWAPSLVSTPTVRK